VRTQGLLKRRTGRATSTISMILQGKRTLQPDDAENWGRAMHLQGDDLAHFVDLARMAHGTEQERREAWERVIARQTFARRTPLPLDHEVFGKASTWTILALVGCEGFQSDPEWIGRALLPPIPAAEVAEALDQLIAAGLVAQAADGTLSKSDAPVATRDGDADGADARWHALHVEQLQFALSSLDRPALDRHVVGVMVAVPETQLDDLVARLEGGIREALVSDEESPPNLVVQITLQIVPRSRTTG
jgi:uncharacterized protein (TIGR02147 family)